MTEIRSATHYTQVQAPVNTGDVNSPINNMISDIFDSKKIVKLDSPAKKEEPQEALSGALPAIEAFSLSVWRPLDELMIVDARNTKLALPTDSLLKNILRHLFPASPLNVKEEVLRCPMIENSFARRTADDARAELQTWLSVQCEIRPFKYLWLMGSNAYLYLLPEVDGLGKNLWQSRSSAGSEIDALIMPALNELLIDPLLKKQLFSAIRRYHS
ncbi:MAG TPA: hypothetical protein VN030_06025 [Cellvibrio sp.]|nr:hypothetical protein [Cellvibrio sp.]